MSPVQREPISTFDGVDWSIFDFVDLGCSNGGSLRFCQKRFGARRGLGVDLDPGKVELARAAGLDVVRADARDLPPVASVRFVAMMNFLEHLPDLTVVEEVLSAAAGAASDFLYIRHPSFEGEAYLCALGLRQYWWHWSGHPAHIRISDYCKMFDYLGLRQYFIRYRDPVLDSSHPTVLTSDMPINQGMFDPELHAPRSNITFGEPVWQGQDIFVALRAFEPAEWTTITEMKPRQSALQSVGNAIDGASQPKRRT